MTPADWERIETLFHDSLELPDEKRRAFLDRNCPASDPLRAEIDSLLAAEQPACTKFEGPPSRLAADLLDRQTGLSPGQRVIHYEIESLISMGGMGEVYRARDLDRQRPVALKILRRHLAANETAIHRFETEARAASALRHPNIVAVHESGNSREGLFIAMEWVDGATWREHMKKGPILISTAIDWAREAAAALAAAHSERVLHRDIKPENLMVTRDGVVKVLDFGLACLTDSRRRVPIPADEPLEGSSGTISGTLSGTLLYMPPEILRGEPATEASDVFSLGAVLHELASGVHPFAGDTPLDVFEAIECRKVMPPSSVRVAIPAELDALILPMLDRDRSRRPPAAEVSARLNKFSAKS